MFCLTSDCMICISMYAYMLIQSHLHKNTLVHTHTPQTLNSRICPWKTREINGSVQSTWGVGGLPRNVAVMFIWSIQKFFVKYWKIFLQFLITLTISLDSLEFFCIFELFAIICLEDICILNGHLICVLICAYMKIMNIEHQASSEHEVGGGED